MEHEPRPDEVVQRLQRLGSSGESIPDAEALLAEAGRRGLLGRRARRREVGAAAAVGLALVLVPALLWWAGPAEAGATWIRGFAEHSAVVLERLLQAP